MTENTVQTGVNKFIDLKNLGLIVAAYEVLKQVFVIDEDILKWSELNSITAQLNTWKDELGKKYQAGCEDVKLSSKE